MLENAHTSVYVLGMRRCTEMTCMELRDLAGLEEDNEPMQVDEWLAENGFETGQSISARRFKT